MELDAFDCPLCSAYAYQSKRHVFSSYSSSPENFDQISTDHRIAIRVCSHCDQPSTWIEGSLVHPSELKAPAAHEHLPDGARSFYEEARHVFGASPRAAAALLRLTIEQLCVGVGDHDLKLSDNIGLLIKREGLPVQIAQALDIVRVVGNKAVHPGQIDLADDESTVSLLFELVNQITEVVVSQPARIKQLFEQLPEGVRDQIARRDSNR